MPERKNYNPIYGSVSIRRCAGENVETIYSPHFFDDGEELPSLRGNEKVIVVFNEVDAVNNGEQINELCIQASKSRLPGPKLEELLKKKLNELLTNRK